MNRLYHVKTEYADVSFTSFEDAMSYYRTHQPAFMSTNEGEYASDTGWFDGLTDEEREIL